MKIGDTVELRHKFSIDSYEENTKAFEISIIAPTEKIHWTIPIYIGTLGIFQEGNRFVVPGGYLPKDHPDHYKVLDANKLIVEMKGVAYRILIGETFRYTGVYTLQPLDRELAAIEKKAAQETTEGINNICYGMVGSIINGEVIRGTVVRLYVNNREGEPVYYESFPNMIVKDSVHKFVVIHDEDTNIEYPVPYEHLTIRL